MSVTILAIIFAILITVQSLCFDYEIIVFQFKYSFAIQLYKLLFLIFSLMFIYVSKIYWRFSQTKPFEFCILILVFIMSSILLMSVFDILSLYLVIEMQSLSLYCLAALRNDSLSSSRSGLKYFIFGSVASGLLVYGLTLFYNETGVTNFNDMHNCLLGLDVIYNTQYTGNIILSEIFILIGFLFKLAIVPFHLWAPDVYADAPIISTLLFSTLAKVAIGFLFLRLYAEVFINFPLFWHTTLVFLLAISSIVGAIGALFETHLLRLLANSGIYNFSFLLLGAVTDTHEGISATLLYIIAYISQNFVLFILIMSLRNYATFEFINDINDFYNIINKHSSLYIILNTVYALSSFSPLLNVMVKINLLWSSLNGVTILILPIINLISSVIMSFGYIRIVRNIYFTNQATSKLVVINKNVYIYFLCTLLLIVMVLCIILINFAGNIY